MGQLSSDITTAGLLHVLGGGVYSRCQCRVHGRDAEADDGVDQTEDKYSHECCQCIFAVLREEVKWHGEILLPHFLSFSLLPLFLFFRMLSAMSPTGQRALVEGFLGGRVPEMLKSDSDNGSPRPRQGRLCLEGQVSAPKCLPDRGAWAAGPGPGVSPAARESIGWPHPPKPCSPRATRGNAGMVGRDWPLTYRLDH